jgi:hypothetical protein
MNFHYRFSAYVWFGVIDCQLTGPFFLEGRRTCQIYAEFKVLGVLEGVRVATLAGMYFQSDRMTVYQSTHSAALESACSWSLDLPLGSTGLATAITGPNPIDIHIWRYMKNLICERKVDTRHTVM